MISNMKTIEIIGFVLLILIGVFMFIYGEYDDSPGGQLIGIILFFIAVGGLIRTSRRNSD